MAENGQCPLSWTTKEQMDFKTVNEMLRRARDVNSEAEVVLVFGRFMSFGSDVSSAAWEACKEFCI